MRLSILFILLFLLTCNVAKEESANDVARFLMKLLKNSIDLQQLEALPAFMTREFTWDTCVKILNFDAYVNMLKIKSTHTGGMPPMSTDWTVIDAHFNGAVLYFKVHNYNQNHAKYPNLLFEAKNIGSNQEYILTRGKSGKCGLLE